MSRKKHCDVAKDAAATCNRPLNVIVRGETENSEMSEPCWLWEKYIMEKMEAAIIKK